MQIVIEFKEDSNLAGMSILENTQLIEWKDLTRQQQVRIVNSLSQFYVLFQGCVKEE